MELVIDNGKPLEPSTTKKVIAAVTRDNKMTMVFSHGDIQKIMVNKIFNETPWLKDYKTGSFKHNLADNTYTLEWEK